MQVSLALLADYANVSMEGKLNVMGIFDEIRCGSFPAVHPDMHVVLRLESSPAERGHAKSLEVHLLNADGRSLKKIAGQFTIDENAPPGRIRHDHILQFVNVQFDEPGDYGFHVLINGEEKAHIPFRVSRTTNA